MARAIITFRLMPTSPDVDLQPIKEQAMTLAREGGAMGEIQAKEDPVAFGLKAVLIMGMFKVETSDFDAIAQKMAKLENVEGAEVAKMDLALG